MRETRSPDKPCGPYRQHRAEPQHSEQAALSHHRKHGRHNHLRVSQGSDSRRYQRHHDRAAGNRQPHLYARRQICRYGPDRTSSRHLHSEPEEVCEITGRISCLSQSSRFLTKGIVRRRLSSVYPFLLAAKTRQEIDQAGDCKRIQISAGILSGCYTEKCMTGLPGTVLWISRTYFINQEKQEINATGRQIDFQT